MKKLFIPFIPFLLLLPFLSPRAAHAAASGCTYPTTLDTFTDVSPSDSLLATVYNKLQCAAEKIEAELGTGPKGGYATVVARLNDAVYTARQVATGTGLTGGGDLSANRTLAIDSTVATLTGTQSLQNKTLDNSNIVTLRDDRLTLQDNADTTKQVVFQLSGITTGTTRTYTTPNSDGTLVLESRSVATGTGLQGGGNLSADRTLSIDSTVATLTGTQSLQNKTLDNTNIVTLRDDRFTIQDNADTTKQAVLQASGITTATTRTYTLPNSDGTLVIESRNISTGTGLSGGGNLSADRTLSIDSTVATLTGTQSLTNKTLDNSNIVTLRDDRMTWQDNLDTTKQAQHQLSSIATATTRTYTWPNASGIVVLESGTVTNSGVVLHSTNPGLETTSGLSLNRSCTTGQILKKTASGWECDADAASAGVTVNAWGSRGQASKNNTTTPNSQFDLIASSVILRNSSNETVAVHNPSTVTNDITAGTGTANGRDQAGAFTAGSWIHFYWVYDGALKSRSSATAPPTGPTLQVGETHWSYAGAVRLDGASQLLRVRIAGGAGWYQDFKEVLTEGQSTTEATVDVSVYVPPNAGSMILNAILRGGTNTTDSSHNAVLRYITGSSFIDIQAGRGAINATGQMGSLQTEMPNVSQQFFYLVNNLDTTDPKLSVRVVGYTLPNGG